jgi:RluA family pseudouridine synthase
MEDQRETFTVEPDERGATLLEVLAERLFDIGTTDIRRLLRDKRVTVDGRAAAPDREVQPGEQVAVDLAEVEEDLLRVEPNRVDGVEVLYEDDHVIAVSKPAGLAVIAERGERDAPFLGAVLAHLLARAKAEGRDRPPRPRIVHRIDKETSGVVLLAKTRDAMRALTAQFEGREVEKEYLALVRGSPLDDEGEVDLPIGSGGRTGKMRTGGRDAKPAQTRWKVVERFAELALLRVAPRTGRQHQIRVHLEAIGYPLAVDTVYGGEAELLLSSVKRGYRRKSEPETPLIGRLSLHASRIVFRSPGRVEKVTVEAPLPHDLEVTLKQLRKWGSQSSARRRTSSSSRPTPRVTD